MNENKGIGSIFLFIGVGGIITILLLQPTLKDIFTFTLPATIIMGLLVLFGIYLWKKK